MAETGDGAARYDANKAHYVVCTCIIHKDGRYLIAKRSEREKAFPGKWTVPGGKLEVNEYLSRPPSTHGANQWYNIFEDLTRREVKEEVGLDVRDIRYVASLTFIRPDKVPTLVVSLCADHAAGEVTLCEDLTAHAWVTAEEAKRYDLIDGIQEELEMVDRMLKGERAGEWKRTS
jgi:8-oxo-dGTP diphosphatase